MKRGNNPGPSALLSDRPLLQARTSLERAEDASVRERAAPGRVWDVGRFSGQRPPAGSVEFSSQRCLEVLNTAT